MENANKEAGTRFLISEALYERVKDEVEMTDFVRVRLRGTSDRMTLYEIAKLTEETERRLNEIEARETMQLAGKTWHKAAPVESLVEGEPKVHRVSRSLRGAPQEGRRDLRLQQRLPASEAAILRAGR